MEMIGMRIIQNQNWSETDRYAIDKKNDYYGRVQTRRYFENNREITRCE